MAVVYELYRPGLIRSYSDKGLYIKNSDGDIYYDAIDPEEAHRIYEETDQEIEIASSEALSMITGEDLDSNDEEEEFIQSDNDILSVILGGVE